MHVLVAAELTYFEPLAVMLYSLLQHNRVDTVFLMTTADGAQLRRIEAVCRHGGTKLSVLVPRDMQLDNAQSSINGQFTHAAFYRLYAGRLIPKTIDQVLYLDADMIIRKSLQPLWDGLDRSVFLEAATFHPAMKKDAFCAPYGGRYFNSGVLNINLSKWRDEDVAGLAERFIAEHADLIRYHDQCVLNYVCRPWREIAITWNFNYAIGPRHISRWNLSRTEFAAIVADPAVLHFLGPVKPWHKSREDLHLLEREFLSYRDRLAADVLVDQAAGRN